MYNLAISVAMHVLVLPFINFLSSELLIVCCECISINYARNW